MLRDLSTSSLIDLLLEIEDQGRSVDVVVRGAGGSGRLCLRGGHLIHAESGELRGLGAFEALLERRQGQCELVDNQSMTEASMSARVSDVLLRKAGNGPTDGAGNFLPRGLFGKTTPGLFQRPPPKGKPIGHGTLLGMPTRPPGSSSPPPAQPPRYVAGNPAGSAGSADSAQARTTSKRVSSNPPLVLHRRKIIDSRYSSTPPAALGEERLTRPKALSLELLADDARSPEDRRGHGAPGAAGAVLADDAPVSSLGLDRKSLEDLEALNEAVSSTSHAIPSPPPLEGRPRVALEAEPPKSEGALPRVGRYEILARLRVGGMGSVYLCRISGSGGFRRLLAMKVLHGHLAEQEDVLELFFREANLLAQVHHPNVVSIIDVGSPQQPYLVLDYVEGGSLHDLLRKAPRVREPGIVTSIVLDALHGLSAVHGLVDEHGQPLGVVHNDVSPQNLLVGVDGTCRLADFGVAEVAGAGLRAPQIARGRPSYASPERIRGGPVDHRSDIFSMGVVLYQALSGVDPFRGETAAETLRNVLDGRVPPPSEVGLRPPQAFDWVCMKAMAARPEERFQTAEEMAVNLRRLAVRDELILSSPHVGAWVRTLLGPELEAQRAAAAQSTALVGFSRFPAARDAEDPAPPPSSSDFGEHTEVLPLGEEEPAPSSVRRRNRLTYAALICAVLLLVGMVFFPDRVAGMFRTTPPMPPTSREAFDQAQQERDEESANEGSTPEGTEGVAREAGEPAPSARDVTKRERPTAKKNEGAEQDQEQR